MEVQWEVVYGLSIGTSFDDFELPWTTLTEHLMICSLFQSCYVM